MKKLNCKLFNALLAGLVILSVIVMTGCEHDDRKNDETPKEEGQSDKVIWQASTDAEMEFISVSNDDWESDSELRSDFEGKPPMIEFENGLDLTGYKYLNFEIYCPDGEYHLIGITGFSFDPYEKVVRTRINSSKEARVIQVPFGVNHGEWPSPGDNGRPVVQPNVSNKLDRLYFLVFDQFDAYYGNLVPGVKVCVKKIVATNQEIKKDPEKDYVVFNATENEGHNFKTTKNEDSGKGNLILFGCNEIGEMDLTDYKYLNFELYSPNIGSQTLTIEGWSETYRTDEQNELIADLHSMITNEPKVYQVPFNETWYDWEAKENKPVSDKYLSHLWFYVEGDEEDSGWIEGIDIYVKRIWATNTKIDERAVLVGSWFYDYGDNQDNFVEEQLTVYDDYTVYVYHEDPTWKEYRTGTCSIIEDDTYGKTLVFNFTKFKPSLDAEYEDCIFDMYYSIQTLNEKEMEINRYKWNNAGEIKTFDPPVKNKYVKNRPLTKENLAGTWRVNKKGTPNCTWDETWVFNADGTMEDSWDEGDYVGFYKGEYQVKTEGNKTVLYQKLTKESSDGTTYTDMASPMEFWYDFILCNEKVIQINCTKDKMGGEEHIKNPPVLNFYYRDSSK